MSEGTPDKENDVEELEDDQFLNSPTDDLEDDLEDETEEGDDLEDDTEEEDDLEA